MSTLDLEAMDLAVRANHALARQLRERADHCSDGVARRLYAAAAVHVDFSNAELVRAQAKALRAAHNDRTEAGPG